MPILDSDIKIKYSIKSGNAGNQSSQANPNDSLGKYISTTEIPDATLNNLFDDVTGDENASNSVEYRCIFVHNNHATLTLMATKVWLQSEVAGGTNVAIAIDNIAANAVNSTNAQAAEIVNEKTAPVNVSAFSSPANKASGLSIGDLPAGQVRAIWIRRTANNSPPINNDGFNLRIEGDTSA